MIATGRAPELAAARLLLERLDVSVEDLLANGPATARSIPSFGKYVPEVIAALPDNNTRALYGSYLRRLATAWPDRQLHEPSATEFSALVNTSVQQRIVRKNDRGGIGTQRNMVCAIRKLYEYAIADGHVRKEDNPAASLVPPPALASRRQALTRSQISDIYAGVKIIGVDPALDALLLRFFLETACRRGGLLGLGREDLIVDSCLVRLREKGGTERLQPISPTLMAGLLDHYMTRKPPESRVGCRARGNAYPITAKADRRLFRYRNGDPISEGKIDSLWTLIGEAVPWVYAMGVSSHWLRHTTLTWVDRRFGSAVAKAFAGHSVRHGSGQAIDIYTKASPAEIAYALSVMTDEAHPGAEDAPDFRSE